MWTDMAKPADIYLKLFIANMPETISTAIPTLTFVKS
jgi:hypothetical protein